MEEPGRLQSMGSLRVGYDWVFSSISLHCSLGRLSYLSLLFFGTLNSNGYIFPFCLWLLLLFFSQLFVRPCSTTILPFSISFSWGWSWALPSVHCHEPPSIVLQALCLSDLFLWIYLSLPLRTKLVEVMEFQLSYFKSWNTMLWKCCTQFPSKFEKLSSGHRTGKGQFSFQS